VVGSRWVGASVDDRWWQRAAAWRGGFDVDASTASPMVLAIVTALLGLRRTVLGSRSCSFLVELGNNDSCWALCVELPLSVVLCGLSIVSL
jgi:hypothetical protein